VEIHELLGLAGEPVRIGGEVLERFDRARSDFTARRFREAADGFREVRGHCGGSDGPSDFYLRLIERFEKEPPPLDWNGVVTFESK